MGETVQFRFSQNVQDLEGKGILDSGVERIDKLSTEELDGMLKAIRNQNPLDRDTINQLYAFVRYFWEIPEKLRKAVSDVLIRFIRDLYHSQQRIEATEEEDQNTTREKFKYYVYFLVFLTRDREKRDAEAASAGTSKKSSQAKKAVASEDDLEAVDPMDEDVAEVESASSKKKSATAAATAWSSERDKYLEALLEVLWVKNQATDLGRVFDSGVPEENFLSLFWQTGELMFERGLTVVRAGSKTRELALSLLAIPTVLFYDSVGHSIASSLWNLIRQHAHAAGLVVDLLVVLSEVYQHDKLARDLIQQLGETDALVVHKNTGSFVEALAERLPALLLSNLSLLLPYLNKKESYQMRCSIIRALPFLVAHLHALKTSSEAKIGTRTKILETLADWGHDTSPYVRAAVSTAWNQLVETRTLPLSHLLTALDLALEATRDKKVIVRKQALGLLENLLATNPFGPDLRVELFVMEIEKRTVELQAMLKEEQDKSQISSHSSSTGARGQADETEADAEPSLLGAGEDDDDEDNQRKSSPDGMEENDEEAVIDDEGTVAETEEEKKKRVLMEALNFLKVAVMFIDKFEQSIPYFCKLLTSTTDDDVLGTIRLFATAEAFKLNGSDRGVRSMLKLIWNNNENAKVKKVLMETVERLYIAKTEGTKRFLFPAKQIANNLVDLAMGASLDELTSLGEVVSEMRKGSETSCLKRTILPPMAVEELWSIILMGKDDPTRARVALCVLGMAAGTTPQVVDDARSSAKLIEAAFGNESSQDFEFARWAFQSLSVATKARGGVCQLGPEERKAVEMAGIHLICGKWACSTEQDRKAWYTATKAALDLIPDLSDSPEKTYYFVLENLYETCKSRNFADVKSMCNLFFVAGHVAIKLLVVAERLVGTIKKTGKKKETTTATTAAPAKNEEEEMLGASAEDETEDVLLRQFAETELLSEGTVFSAVLEWAKKLVLADRIPSELRQCAVLALCKFMSVSERCCEDNLSLLFTVLRDALEPETRSIVVISEGDLAFRFPNALEPFTSAMYKSLRDVEVSVRKNALMVLTHLALNDMIKVRGEVSEIAMRLEDDDKGVRDLARFFFAELAKRGTNPIYNLLPDILGSLSRESPSLLGPNKFRNLAKFLLEFVDKEKQCEQLADKLCHRIHTTCGGVADVVVPSQLAEFQICRDLSFCLEQLKFSDALLKRFNDDSDLFKCIRPVLGDSQVFASISKLISKASPKSQESKRTLEELQEKVNRLHAAQAQDIATFDKASQKRGSGAKKVNEKNVGSIMEEAAEQLRAKQEQENELQAANKKTKRGAATTAKRKPKKSADNDDEEEEEVPKAKSRGRKKIVEHDDDEAADDENAREEIVAVAKQVKARTRRG